MARFLIAAGASGGHVYPALAVGLELRERGHGVVFAGGTRMEARVFPEAGFEFHSLGVRRPPSVRAELVTPRGMLAAGSILWSIVRAWALLRRLRVAAVLGSGGYASVPVTLAAGLGRVPLVLQEQNANLSFAQRLALRRASALALGLPLEAPPTREGLRIVHTGNPIREEIRDLALAHDDERARRRAAVRASWGLPDPGLVLLVMGGSLTSPALNEAIPAGAGAWSATGASVLHVAGAAWRDAAAAAWRDAGVHAVVLDYCDRMHDAYAAADVAVSRSGALTVAELAAIGLPAVLVPLETLARGDQTSNARVLERAGAARLVPESGPRPDGRGTLAERAGRAIAELLLDDALRARMAAAARRESQPDATPRVADLLEAVSRTR